MFIDLQIVLINDSPEQYVNEYVPTEITWIDRLYINNIIKISYIII